MLFKMAKVTITKVPRRITKEMAESTRRYALPTLIKLADWRNQSGSSPQQIVPYSIRREAESYIL